MIVKQKIIEFYFEREMKKYKYKISTKKIEKISQLLQTFMNGLITTIFSMIVLNSFHTFHNLL